MKMTVFLCYRSAAATGKRMSVSIWSKRWNYARPSRHPDTGHCRQGRRLYGGGRGRLHHHSRGRQPAILHLTPRLSECHLAPYRLRPLMRRLEMKWNLQNETEQQNKSRLPGPRRVVNETGVFPGTRHHRFPFYCQPVSGYAAACLRPLKNSRAPVIR